MSCTETFSLFLVKVSSFLNKVIYFDILSIFGNFDVKIPLLIALIMSTTVFLLFKYRFLNLRYLAYGIKTMFSEDDIKKEHDKKGKIESIRAVFTAIAGAAGLGSISGVAIGIAIGGPGATFWMIVVPFLTMPIRFTEVFLGHNYRIKTETGYDGGPTYYIKKGFADIGYLKTGVFLSFLYGIFLIISTFGGPSSFQSNQVVRVLSHNFSFVGNFDWLISAIFATIVTIVLIGGVKRTANVLSSIVPVIIAVYFISSTIVIIANYKNIPNAAMEIITMAFSLKSVYGGIIGAFVVGFTRVVIAGEIGMGTASIVHSNVANKDSVKEGIVAMSAPIIEILFISSMTSLVVVVTGVYKESSLGVVDVYKAFATVSSWFPYIVALIVPFMGLNVVIAWGFYGERITRQFFGNVASKIFLILYVAVTFLGGLTKNIDLIVALLDSLNTMMIFPNAIALCCLSGIAWKGIRHFKPKK